MERVRAGPQRTPTAGINPDVCYSEMESAGHDMLFQGTTVSA